MYTKEKIYYENIQNVNSKYIDSFKKNLNNPNKISNYILGKNVNKFENEFEAYNSKNKRYGVGVGNGLDALTFSLLALNLKKNSEVLVPANTYVASILSIVNAGLKPILIDPSHLTCNLSLSQLKKRISKKTKAILVVHLYGLPCSMKEIMIIAKKYKLKVIEDCAQAIGATYLGKKVGTFGDFGCFSFYPTKHLGAIGDGGLVSCKNKKDQKIIKMLRNYGSIKRYKNEIVGYNSRLDEIQAIFLRIKLKDLNNIIKKKIYLAKIYNKLLDNKKFILPFDSKNQKHVYYVYGVRTDHRSKIKNVLSNNNIYTDVHYPTPPYKQKALKKLFNKQKFPISDKIHSSILSLPISCSHKKKDIEKICKILNNIKI